MGGGEEMRFGKRVKCGDSVPANTPFVAFSSDGTRLYCLEEDLLVPSWWQVRLLVDADELFVWLDKRREATCSTTRGTGLKMKRG